MIFPDKEVSEASEYAYQNRITIIGRERFSSWVQTLNKRQLEESFKLHATLFKFATKTAVLGTTFAIGSGLLWSGLQSYETVNMILGASTVVNTAIGALSIYTGSAGYDAKKILSQQLKKTTN